MMASGVTSSGEIGWQEALKADDRKLRIGGLSVTILGDGPPLLMSAGLGGLGSYWSGQIKDLSSNYQVILYDHRGTGDSCRAPLPTPYTIQHMAGDIRLILEEVCTERPHLVGHALGALATLEVASQDPGAFRSLSLVCAWARSSSYFQRCLETRLNILRHMGADTYLKLQPLFLYPADWTSDHLAILDGQAEAHAPTFQSLDVLEARVDALLSYEAPEHLGPLEARTLIISATDDMLVPSASSKALKEQYTDARHVEFSWGGHALNQTNPQKFNNLINSFISEGNH